MSFVRTEIADRIAVLTIDRQEKLNALNSQVLAELDGALEAARTDPAVGVVILTGAGPKAFVAGADISELSTMTPLSGRDHALKGQGVLGRIETLGKPVIAAINGFALGGGCELAMACTLRVASTNAKLGQPEVRLGIIPGFGGSQRLARLVGKGRAMEICLTAEPISAEEALRIGLVNRVVPLAEIDAAADALAGTLLARGPVALRLAMQAIHEGLQMSLAEGLSLEAVLFGLSCATDDMREGTRAFVEKRKPQFPRR